MLPPRKLHLYIKFTTLSLTMIIKQPLNAHRHAQCFLSTAGCGDLPRAACMDMNGLAETICK